MAERPFDVCVVGGGIVGNSTALLYARAGYQVVLVDARPPLRPVREQRDALNVRTVALAWRSVSLLQQAGLWDSSFGYPIRSIHVSARGQFGAVRMHADDFHLPALGWVVANADIEAHLAALCVHDPLIQVAAQTSMEQLTQHQDGVVVSCRQADAGLQQYRARLLVAADGTESLARKLSGVEAQRRRYDQLAIVANVQCARGHGGQAFERFTDQGPLALLPIGEQELSLVLTLPSALAEPAMVMADDQFLQLLQQRFGGRLGRFLRVGTRRSFALEQVASARQVNERCVLLGNAARTLHPVAGQGLNLALRDVFQLVGSNMQSAVADPGSEQVLAHFTARRAADQQRVSRQTDALARVFNYQPAGLNRIAGLLKTSSFLAMDLIPAIRQRFGSVNAGLGIALDTPPAVEGVLND